MAMPVTFYSPCYGLGSVTLSYNCYMMDSVSVYHYLSVDFLAYGTHQKDHPFHEASEKENARSRIDF